LAKQPTILILDDSVSAVDTKTEESIIRNLRKVRQGKTTLLVAHRISTVKKLDKIIVLDQGMLVGFGTHESLLASNAIYQDMVRLQTLENLVGETKHA
jgi:ATP-binding cassette subfamily B protein